MKNILLAGVGGQGLVMTTDMICEAAFRSGYDVKSNDVVGLSQRGGKVWGSVRYGAAVHSPNIGMGEADLLLALEPLEALRWQAYLKPGGVLLTNTSVIYPVFAIGEQAPYPHDYLEQFRKDVTVRAIDALAIGLDIGSNKIVNVVMLGVLAGYLDISTQLWHDVIAERVPPKSKAMNAEAFERGMALK